MQAKVIYYWDGDPPAVQSAAGYVWVRFMDNGVRYKFGIIRREEDPTYSVVDIQTGYRYPTNARTIHDATRFARSVVLKDQPLVGNLGVKQCLIIQGYYDGVPWEKNFWNADNPDGFNSQKPDWVEGRKDYGDNDSEHD